MKPLCKSNFSDTLTNDEANHALKLAKKHKLELELLIKVSDITEWNIRNKGYNDCYVWSDACFEIGLNYEKNRKLNRKDVEKRLEESLKMGVVKDDLRKYWLKQVEICSNLLG